MAKIPMVNRPQVQQHRDNAVHVTGGPGLNWRVDDSLGKLGEAVGQGLGNVARSFVDLDRALQETEDKNQFYELELLEKEQSGNAQRYFSENPTEHGKFGEYLTTLESDADERRKEIYDKMSPRARERANYFVRQNQLQRQQYMGKVQYQARVTAQLQTMENQITKAVQLGDWDLAQNIINDASQSVDGKTPALLSPELKEKYLMHAMQQKDFYEARDLIDKGKLVPPVMPGEKEFKSVSEILKAKDKAGNYSYATNLSQPQRQQLIRYDEQQQAQREVKQIDDFYARLLAGEPIEQSSIDAQRDNGTISQRTHNQFTKALQQLESEKKRNQISLHDKKQTYNKDLMALAIMDYRFSPDPVERDKQINEINTDIMEKFGVSNPAYAKALKTQLNSTVNALSGDKANVKNSYIYKYAMQKLDDVPLRKLYSRIPGRGESWYSWFTNVYDDSDDIKQLNFAMLKVAVDDFIKENPTAKQNEVDAFIKSTKEQINWTETDKLLEFYNTRTTPRKRDLGYFPKPGEVLRIVNGKKALYDAKTKRFKRYIEETK